MRSLLSPHLWLRCALVSTVCALGPTSRAQSLSDWAGFYTSQDGRSLDLRVSDASGQGQRLVGSYRFSAGSKYDLTIVASGSLLSCSYELPIGRVLFSLRRTPDGVTAAFATGEVAFRRGLRPLSELLAERQKNQAKIPALANLGPPRVDASRQWTILCYLAADNDLEAAALLDLLEIREGLPASGVEVLVLIDRASGFATDPENDWTDSRLLRVHRPKPQAEPVFEILARPGELDMGDPEVLASFVAGGLKTFPAKHEMLILWDHGGGWVGQCMDLDAPGSAQPTELSLVEVRQGIEKGLKLAGHDRLDAIGFDQCLMAQLETAVELEGLADYLLASEAIEPGYGWPYQDFLPLFAEGRSVPEILTGGVEAFARSYAELDASTTLSVLDLRQVDAFLGHFETLLARCESLLTKSWPQVSRSLYYGESYAGRSDVRRGSKALASVDLFDVLMRSRLSIQPFPAEEEFEAFENAHRKLVVHRHAGSSRPFSHGVSIYAPPSRPQWNAEYLKTRLGSRKPWVGFLTKLHDLAAADRTALRFANGRTVDQFGKPTRTATALEGDNLQIELFGNNVIWTRFEDCEKSRFGGDDLFVRSTGFLLDSKWIMRLGDPSTNPIDRMMPRYTDGRNLLRHELHGIGFRITDGRLSGRATMLWSEPDAAAPLAVLARYEHPDAGGFSIAEVQFDPITWQATRVVAYVPQPDGRVVPRIMPKDRGGEVTLLTQVIEPDGARTWQRGTFLQWSSALRLEPAPFTLEGDRVAILTAETMGGRSTSARVPYRIVEGASRKRWRESWSRFGDEFFTGRWEQSFLGPEGKWQPLNVTLNLSAEARDRYAAEVRFAAAGSAQGLAAHTWHLYPEAGAVRIVAKGQSGRPDQIYWGPMELVSRDELVMKAVSFGGVLWRFRRVD